MCERYTLGASKEQLEQRFGSEMLENFHSRYNIAPTQLLPVITSDSPAGFSHFYWGTTPGFAKNKPLSLKYINAAAETAATKAATKSAFMRRRCIIPADGYYAWKKIGKKTKIPHRFVFPPDRLMSFAGLWEEYENENGEINHTFIILTVPANPLHRDFGDTMPAILDKGQEKIWLDKYSSPEQLQSVLSTYSEDKMTNYPVSPNVNFITNDSEYLIRKTSPMDQFGNYTLFG